MTALHCGYTPLGGGFKLGIVLGNSGRIYYKLCTVYILGAVSHKHLYSQSLYAFERVAFVIVRPRKYIALAVEYLGNGAHSAPADTNHMNSFNLGYYFILCAEFFHILTPFVIILLYYIAFKIKNKHFFEGFEKND